MANGFISKNPRSIDLFLNGQEVSPKKLFELAYQDLQKLIELNNVKISQKDMNDSIKMAQLAELKMNLKGDWQQKIQSQSLEAKVVFDDACEKKYLIRPRFNFYQDFVLKTPNVMVLSDKAGGMAILREARIYPWKEFMLPNFINRLGEKADREKTFQFYKNEEGLADFGDINKLVYIPEPQLLCALERMYNDSRIPRISPRIKIMDHDDENMWFLRDFLPLAVETHLSSTELGQYTGILRSLGLLEYWDRQLIHYCVVYGETLGNYDLDFMLHSISNRFNKTDQGNLSKVYREESGQYSIQSPRRMFFKPLNKAVRETTEEMQEQGIDKKTIMKYMTKKIDVSDQNII